MAWQGGFADPTDARSKSPFLRCRPKLGLPVLRMPKQPATDMLNPFRQDFEAMHDAGLSKEVKALAERAARLYVERCGACLIAPPGLPQSGALSSAEALTLDAAGLDIAKEVETGEANPAVEAIVECLGILFSAMTVRETADMLGVSPGRVRQMIRDGSLAAVRENRRYLVPEFQFHERRLIPSFASVYRSRARDVPLLLFYRWFIQPSCDLPAPGDAREGNLSPREWLQRGYDPQPVERMSRLL